MHVSRVTVAHLGFFFLPGLPVGASWCSWGDSISDYRNRDEKGEGDTSDDEVKLKRNYIKVTREAAFSGLTS